MSPVGGSHGGSVVRLAIRVGGHAEKHDLGWVTTEVGFVLARGPDLVRGPDLAFVTKARVPAPIPSTFVELAPDLVVEGRLPRRHLQQGVREGA